MSVKHTRAAIILLFLCFALIVIPLAHADATSLSCGGEGQAFIHPEYLEERTITIPCTVSGTAPVNETCLGMLLFENQLISTAPAVQSINLFGKSSFYQVQTTHSSASFVVDFSNRDLLHLRQFEWKVVCRDTSNNELTSNGTFTTEYPFSEVAVAPVLDTFFRDVAFTFVLIFGGIVLIAFIFFIIRRVWS